MRQARTAGGDTIPQPVAVVGPEGSGKTTILHRLALQLDSVKQIDGRRIFSSEDLIEQSMSAKFVLLDNADFYFQRCSYDNQYKLRGFLNQVGAPMLVCAIKRINKAFVDYAAPFFDGFQFVYIPQVEIDTIPGVDKIRLHKLIELSSPFIRNINLAYSVINSCMVSSEDVGQFIEIFTSKYSLIYDRLSPTAQRIVNSLADQQSGVRLGEIRKATGLSSSTISSYMTGLMESGIVSRETPSKLKSTYRLRDRGFAFWVSRM